MKIDALLMGRYNQQYSEIENIPTETIMFLIRLAGAEDKYITDKTNKNMVDMKNKKGSVL